MYPNFGDEAMKAKTFMTAAVFLGALAVQAAPSTFKIGGGNPAQQIATVESVTDFETFTGVSSDITGTINFDPAKKTGTGKITVNVKGIKTGIDLRDDHMRGEQWLNAAKFPTITFEATGVKPSGGDKYKVTGKFTMRGVTKTITVDANVKHMAKSAATQGAGFKGDVLQVKTSFNVKLSDYGIKISGPATGKVANQVKIGLTVYAQNG